MRRRATSFGLAALLHATSYAGNYANPKECNLQSTRHPTAAMYFAANDMFASKTSSSGNPNQTTYAANSRYGRVRVSENNGRVFAVKLELPKEEWFFSFSKRRDGREDIRAKRSRPKRPKTRYRITDCEERILYESLSAIKREH